MSAPSVTGLHHVTICTRDYDRAVTFYRDVLGLPIENEFQWEAGSTLIDSALGIPDSAGRVTLLRCGDALLEIHDYGSASPAQPGGDEADIRTLGIRHVGLSVTDIDATYAYLSERGVRFVGPPTRFGPATAVVYARDPDGNFLEFMDEHDRSA